MFVFAACAVVLWLVASFAVASRLTRRARPLAPEPLPTVPWGTAEALALHTSDGQTLGAWFFAGRSDRPTVVLLHGNGGSRTACLPQVELLATAGHPVLAVTLRAHGDSTGDRNDIGYSARHDVSAAIDWLEVNHPKAPVVVWGRSLGSAAALFAARDLGTRVYGYILECPYRDLRTAVWNRLHSRLPPVLDHIAYAGLRITAPIVLPDFDRIAPIEAAPGVPRETPVLVLAGGRDSRATPDEAREIVARLGPRTELVVIEEGDHLELSEAGPDQYRSAVFGFLDLIARERP
ncbi:alpha/beta fold hydrolase [Gemmata sp. G18]|uniref:Alpha/beta fold hydrolase n=1 Tax=Gemmata palustris TaxID=2822762 RepID=A0ABS5C2A0_9BACT|nr:alpha/beta fold hydrolase [Gemmata palustris]MBP3959600.1 alpha/beta fold hydrolase [Gemmata palustris]